MSEAAPATARDLELTLRTLDRVARPVRRRPDRETWRFDVGDRGYRLHFFTARRRFGTSPAVQEFAALKTLQTQRVPAVRVVALLSGFRFGDRIGDAVVTYAIEPAVRLDAIDPADHARARRGVIDWLATLAAAGLGHADLRPGSFLLTPDGVVLADAIGLRFQGVQREHLMQFAYAAGDRATRADRVRAWRRLVPGEETPPPDNRVAFRLKNDLNRLAVCRLRVGAWTGRFLGAAARAEWSAASPLSITAEDWQREAPRLLASIEADTLDVLKRDASGDVLGGRVTLAGVPIDVIVKRSRNKTLLRRLFDPRRSRAWRTWTKALQLLVRRVPTERPLAVLERRVAGYAAESLVIFERVPGVTLEHVELDAMSPADRETLFRRCGRTLRRIEDTHLTHTDAKSSNWIVFPSPTAGPSAGPVPVLVDLYGVRPMNPWLHAFGVRRLLRAMKRHPQYTPLDSLHLCQGFAPQRTPQADAPTDQIPADLTPGAGDAH